MTNVKTPFRITSEGHDYIITPHDYTDQVFYHIQVDDQPIFVIGLNENAEWEATSGIDDILVKKAGAIIEENSL